MERVTSKMVVVWDAPQGFMDFPVAMVLLFMDFTFFIHQLFCLFYNIFCGQLKYSEEAVWERYLFYNIVNFFFPISFANQINPITFTVITKLIAKFLAFRFKINFKNK